MINEFKYYLDGLFSTLPDTAEVVEAKSNLYDHLIQQYRICIEQGLDQQTAYESAVKSIGDVSDLIAGLNKNQDNSSRNEEKVEQASSGYSRNVINDLMHNVSNITTGFVSGMLTKVNPTDLMLVNKVSLPLDNVADVKIKFISESITINASQDGKFTVREYMNQNDPELLVIVQQSDNSIDVKHGRRKGISLRSRVEIDVPLAWRGTLSISTIYGDIYSEYEWNLSNCQAKTIGGNIYLKSVSAKNIRLSTSIGSLVLDSCVGNMELRTISGNIRVRKASGGGIISTIGGDMSVYFEDLNKPVKLSSENGEIYLHLSQDASFEIDAVSLTGRIFSSFNTVRNLIGLNTNNAHGHVGKAPFQEIEISTSTGSIHISD